MNAKKSQRKKAEYRSSLRSKRIIREAFLSLLKEKELSKITVTDIIRRTDLNRGTFYAHYPDVRGVIEEIEDETIEKLLSVLGDFHYDNFFQNPVPVLLKVNRYLEEDLEFYRTMIMFVGTDNIFEKIKSSYRKYMLEKSDIPESVRYSIMYEMRGTFFIAGILDLYKQWFLGNLSGTLNDIPIEVGRLIAESTTNSQSIL